MMSGLERTLGLRAAAAADPNAGVAENHRTIIGVSVFSIVLATAPVVARLLFRRTSKLQWLADDYFIIVAAVVSNANAACYLWDLRYGFGEHIYVVAADPLKLVNFFKVVFATFILYGTSVSFVKFSVLAFYDRIFPRNNFKTWLYTLGALSVIWWILITLVSIFECHPIAKAWNDELEGTCIPYLDLFIGIQVANILLDIAILVLPISAVMKLQMARSNKISVAGTFALGGFAVVFGIIRLAILVQDIHQTDITYATPTATWSLVEPSFEIFCACLPAMTPLLKAGRWLVKVTSTLSYGSRKSNAKNHSTKDSAAIHLTPPGAGPYDHSLSTRGFHKMSVSSENSTSSIV